MIRAKGIIDIHNGYADTSELLDSVDSLGNGEYGYLLFDKKKNRSLPQALYRYFEEIYAPIHSCKIPGEKQVFEYFDLKNENATEMDTVITKIIHHAMSEWNIDLLSRDLMKTSEAQEAYAGAYAEMWKNYTRKI